MVEVVAPLRLFLEELMAGAARRTKRVAKNGVIPPAAWTEGRLKAWEDAQDLVAHAVTLYYPLPGRQVLMFTDAFECHWGSFVAQVPDAEMDQNLPVEDMTHEGRWLALVVHLMGRRCAGPRLTRNGLPS